MDNNMNLSDLELFEQLLSTIGQPFDSSTTLNGYDIECLSPESHGLCIEFDENKKFN